MRRIRALANLPSLNEYRSLRSTPLNLDVVFVSGFYGRPDPTEGDNFRYEVMKSIKSIPDLTCRVGFVSRGVLSGKFAELQIRPMHLHEYLRQLARCRIGIYVRGAHNCLSFKLGQLLALGKPMVGQSIPNSNGSISRIPFFQRQFGYDSPKQIAARVWELSRDAEQRQEIGSANMTAYEQHFTPEAVAKLILRSLVEGRS